MDVTNACMQGIGILARDPLAFWFLVAGFAVILGSALSLTSMFADLRFSLAAIARGRPMPAWLSSAPKLLRTLGIDPTKEIQSQIAELYATGLDVERAGQRLELEFPLQYRIFWKGELPILHFVLNVAPLLGLVGTLLRLTISEGNSARVFAGERLIASVIGIAIAIGAATLIAMASSLDAPARLRRAMTAASRPAPKSRRKSTTLAAHVAPALLPAIFLVAWSDLLLGLVATAEPNVTTPTTAVVIAGEGQADTEPAFLELIVDDEQITLGGYKLKKNIAAQVQKIIKQALAISSGSRRVHTVNVLMRPGSACEIVFHVESVVQAEFKSATGGKSVTFHHSILKTQKGE